jgi:hypothetical protein
MGLIINFKRMNKAQVNTDLDEIKRWKKVLLNLSRCRRQE